MRFAFACVVIVFLSRISFLSAGDVLPPPGTQPVDFSQVQAIFNLHCISCHDGSSAPQGLQLSEFRSYTLLVNVPSQEVPALKRVQPGDAGKSYLFQKINSDTPKQGVRMPLGGLLLVEDQALIRDWINQGALPTNESPTITSGPSASSTIATAGQLVTFSAAANDPDHDPITFTWNFGDGTSQTGSSVIHGFQSSGVFTVTVVVSDGRGGTAQATIPITIQSDDSDNDGVPDVIETALGFNPLDPTSTPTQGGAIAVRQPLSITSFSAKVDFAQSSNDALSVKGSFKAPGVSNTSRTAVLAIGNFVQMFQLNDKGSATAGSSNMFSLKIAKSGSVLMSARLAHVALKSGLFGVQSNSSSVNKLPLPVRVYIFAANTVYQADIVVLYTQKNSSGNLTLKK